MKYFTSKPFTSFLFSLFLALGAHSAFASSGGDTIIIENPKRNGVYLIVMPGVAEQVCQETGSHPVLSTSNYVQSQSGTSLAIWDGSYWNTIPSQYFPQGAPRYTQVVCSTN